MASYLPCFIFLFLTFPFIIIAQTHKNITLGSSLVAGDVISSWLSPSEDFAFGFQEIEPGNFLLAIWFNQISEKTITWSANRDHLVPSGSKIDISTESQFVLTDPRGQEIWRAKYSGDRLAYTALLDTGNFVLATQSGAVLWQSFDEPTDTLLPSQTLKPGGQLLATYSEKNQSSGRFSFELRSSRDLALFTTNFPLFNSLNSYYWKFNYQGLGSQVVFNQSGLLYLASQNGSILTGMFSDDQAPGNVRYQRVILEYDGVLRHYVYPSQPSHSTGWSVKSFAPDNICTAVIQDTGSGVCGYNSYCQFGNDCRPHCLCPPGYTLLDPNFEMGGCNQDFSPQICQEPSHEKNQFELKMLKDVDWPLSDYEHFQNVSKDWCREVCSEDCFCAVGIFREGGDCWKKKLPLSNGKSDSSVDRIAFIKVRISGELSERKYKKSNRILAGLLGTSGLANVLFMCIILVSIWLLVHRKKKMDVNPSKTNGDYSVMLSATMNSVKLQMVSRKN